MTDNITGKVIVMTGASIRMNRPSFYSYMVRSKPIFHKRNHSHA